MRESIGTAFVTGLVITFIIIFMVFFATSTSYTKAFKVKNKIVEILEKYDDILHESPTNSGRLTANVEAEISALLSDIGYRISPTQNNCPARNGQAAVTKSTSANYEYCIYEYSTPKGKYYGVTAYIYYEIPVFGIELRFPVYGETKINGILG